MATADRVDILVAFIKWTGLRLLQPAFEVLATRGVPVRIVTTKPVFQIANQSIPKKR
jgi:HKD family nuclease